MKAPLIIGVAGKMGAGKDTIGQHLKDRWGYTRDAFADALRREVQAALVRREISPAMPPEISALLLECRAEDVWAKPTNPAMRRLLQLWGTEYRRAQDPAYWLKSIHFRPSTKTVVTDVRFPNEATLIWALGGEVWLVERGLPTEVFHQHASEALGFPADRVIPNDGTIDDLNARVDAIMEHYV